MTPADLTFLETRVPLMTDLSRAAREAVVAGSHVATFAAGETVLRAGEPVPWLGIVMAGDIEAAATGAEGGRHEVARFREGDTFGEAALLSGEPAVTECRAVEASRILCVPPLVFQEHILTESAALRRLSRNVSTRFHRLVREAAAAAEPEDGASLPTLQSGRREGILVINCGSSSLKYAFFDTARPDDTIRGQVEGIGSGSARLVQRGPRGEAARDLGAGGHAEAFAAMVGALTDASTGAIREAGAVTAVGHRVVHGGRDFGGPAVVDEAVLAKIEALGALAPLHNPVNALGLREARRVFPGVPQVAVFDTAFHSTLPAAAQLYGLPFELAEAQGIRRYGFHGTSHHHAALTAARFLDRGVRSLRLVSCHLGNGASVCAVDHGRSVDTTMGFTPGEGLVMGTRCGDIDAGVLIHLMRTEGMGPDALEDLLNRRSGLLGLSGLSGDMREIERAAEAGHARALTALRVFCHRVRKAIGASVAAMGGLDALVFTAGIGEHSAGVRAAALQGLRCMGLHLDEARNRAATGGPGVKRISPDDAPVAVLVVPTDEERMIAGETLRALRRESRLREAEGRGARPVPIEVSAHHVHLCQEHVEALFGPGQTLTKHADLSQPGQYACAEQVTLVGPKGRIERVRVLGPVRRATQVEIAMTEQFKLGIDPPIRESGDLEGTPGCELEGPAGRVALERGVICALRHIHMTPEDARRYGVEDRCAVRVRIPGGDREMIFGDVRVRVDERFALAMHIDTDEANAADLKTGAVGYIEGIQSDD